MARAVGSLHIAPTPGTVRLEDHLVSNTCQSAFWYVSGSFIFLSTILEDSSHQKSDSITSIFGDKDVPNWGQISEKLPAPAAGSSEYDGQCGRTHDISNRLVLVAQDME
jgi:hypothetical protein